MSSLAQTNTNVKLNGNAAAAGDFIGTTNNENLVIKTNGQNHTVFQKDGDLKVVGLQGALNRLLYASDNGVIKPLAQGTAEQVLLGDLTWGTLPQSYWSINANGNKLFTTINKVGINTNNPAFNLDVNGDGHFSGNLVLNGELIINEKITSPKQLTTAKVVADSIMMGDGKALYGETTIKGDVKLKYRLDVTGDAVFNGSQEIYGNQSVQGSQFLQGNQDIQGNLFARNGLMFNNEAGIKFIGETATTPEIISLGKQVPNISQILANNCATPSQLSPTIFYGGKIQLYDQASNTSLTMGSDGYQSIIESQGNNNLLLNYYCGKDVGICRGPNGGTVKLGKKVDAAQNIRIGYFGADPFIDNTSLSIAQNDLNGTAIKLNVWEGTVKAINLENPGNNVSSFVVWQNGRTQIGANPTPSSAKLEINGSGSSLQFFANVNGDIQSTTSLRPHFASNKDYTIYEGNVGSGEAKYSIVNDKHTFYINATRPANLDAFELWDTYNNKAFFKVKTNGFVYAREVTVTLANDFPDYVFAKDYKLMPLTDVRAFTEKYHHLPNMPTANTVQTEGANLGEIQRVTVEKVEELYKYIFEMEAELKELRKLVGELKSK